MVTESRSAYLKVRYALGLLLASVMLAAALVFVTNVWVVRSTEPYVYGDVAALPVNDVGLLLGTSPYTRKGNDSKLFRHRIEAAADLYHAGKIRHIIASGANPDDTYNEPRKMYRALLAAGVPAESITMDFAGFRTLDSVIRASAVFRQPGYTIISQRFHDYRAVFIARQEGIAAIAYAAPEVKEQQKRHVLVREYLARTNAVLDLYVLRTQPRFLGDPIELQIGPTAAAFTLGTTEGQTTPNESSESADDESGTQTGFSLPPAATPRR